MRGPLGDRTAPHRPFTATLPYDTYQVALVPHPDARPRPARRPALPGPYEEWSAALVAADPVITDHGITALHPAALDRPPLGAYDGARGGRGRTAPWPGCWHRYPG
ncbi:hypothetical protein ACFV5N_09645 [Streptomyces sp. NPDC059853]|uniref:hypothetical protein n=1 Tax=Streptomyces sp. NPDC059853 TaxID=3346973 RepID=UPI003663B188